MDSWRGWVTVAAAFLSMAVVFGVAYSFGAFFAPMAAEFGAGSGATSVVFGVTAFCWFVLGAVSGRITDRTGPRPVLLTGAAALLAGLLLTSITEQLWLGYLTYGLGVGIAVACGYVPMVAAVGGWFERQRAVAIAVAVAGIGVGTLLGAPLAAALIGQVGWRQTDVLFGVVGAALLVVAALLARRPPVPPDASEPVLIRELWRSGRFRGMYGATLLASFALFVPLVYLPVAAADAGPVAAAALVGVIGMASVAGRLALGAVADRFGRVRTFQGSFALMALAFPLWLFAGSYAVLALFAAVLGVGYGGWIALQPAVVAEIYGSAGLGATVGFVYTAAGIGALVGPFLSGMLVDTGGFGWAIGAAWLSACLGFVALLPLGRVRA